MKQTDPVELVDELDHIRLRRLTPKPKFCFRLFSYISCTSVYLFRQTCNERCP